VAKVEQHSNDDGQSSSRKGDYRVFCKALGLHEGHLDQIDRRQDLRTVLFGKASPGNIDRSRSYFVISKGHQHLELHTDIQVKTLGASLIKGWVGKSGYHEIDLVLIDPGVPDGDMPQHDQVVLGVECKSHAKFDKGIVKQVLGIRRELSFLSGPTESILEHFFGPVMHIGGDSPIVNANPASLYWVTYVDPKGDDYKISPSSFSIEFKHWQP
jgi:hypothetical protein